MNRQLADEADSVPTEDDATTSTLRVRRHFIRLAIVKICLTPLGR